MGVCVVGGPEKCGRYPREGFNETLGGIELKSNDRRGCLGKIRVGERVVAYLVALRNDSSHEVGVEFRFLTHDKKESFDAPFFEDVEDAGCPVGIRAIIEGDRDAIR